MLYNVIYYSLLTTSKLHPEPDASGQVVPCRSPLRPLPGDLGGTATARAATAGVGGHKANRGASASGLPVPPK